MPAKTDAFPELPGCACYGDVTRCVCQTEERYLHAVIAGEQKLTPEQRAWCVEEIIHVEGYDESDAQGTDEHVASTVLRAWTDFCRDKGLL